MSHLRTSFQAGGGRPTRTTFNMLPPQSGALQPYEHNGGDEHEYGQQQYPHDGADGLQYYDHHTRHSHEGLQPVGDGYYDHPQQGNDSYGYGGEGLQVDRRTYEHQPGLQVDHGNTYGQEDLEVYSQQRDGYGQEGLHVDKRHLGQEGLQVVSSNTSARTRTPSGKTESTRNEKPKNDPSISTHALFNEKDYRKPKPGVEPVRVYTQEIPPPFDGGPQQPRQPPLQGLVNKKRPNYKPTPLRWPYLVSLLMVVIILFGLMIYSLKALPGVESNLTDLVKRQEDFGERLELVKRQDGASDTTDSSTSTDTSSATDSGSTDSGDSSSTGGDSGSTDSGSTDTDTDTTHGGDSDSTTSPIAVGTQPPDNHATVDDSVTVTATVASTVHPTVDGSVTVTNGGSEGTIPPPSSQAETAHPTVGTLVTVTGSGGSGVVTYTSQKPTYMSAAVVTLTNSEGKVTATSTSTPPAISTPQTTVLTNSVGAPTATVVTSVLATPVTKVLTNAQGIPTATQTTYPVLPSGSAGDDSDKTVYFLSSGGYFVGTFVPTLATIILSAFTRVLDTNAKLFQPWHELTHAAGGLGRDTLCLPQGGISSTLMSIRSLLGGRALVFLTTFLSLCAALLVPLSAEAIAITVYGGCEGKMNVSNCAIGLSVYSGPAQATIALLVLMAVGTGLIMLFLRKWQTGVATNPWSLCGVASLSQNDELRRLFAAIARAVGSAPQGSRVPINSVLSDVLSRRQFRLGYFQNPGRNVEYGIVLAEGTGQSHTVGGQGIDDIAINTAVAKHTDHGNGILSAAPTFFMLGYLGRSLFLSVLVVLLGVIVYYNNTGGDTPFERFMGSESFGVRFLFTGVGVVITSFWGSFFSSIAATSPYHLLTGSPQPPTRSILLSPPTNAISGIISGIQRRHTYLVLVAFVSILSEFLTLCLAQVPFRVTQTWTTGVVCIWASQALLVVMIIVVLLSFWTLREGGSARVDVDPASIAGSMWYVVDSWMMDGFEGLSTLRRKERDRVVRGMGRRYEFGRMVGVSGAVRTGVDMEGRGA